MFKRTLAHTPSMLTNCYKQVRSKFQIENKLNKGAIFLKEKSPPYKNIILII